MKRYALKDKKGRYLTYISGEYKEFSHLKIKADTFDTFNSIVYCWMHNLKREKV